MQIVIKIPKEFEEHFNKDKFSDSLARVASDIENFGVPLSGRYEQETITMLRKAFEDATPLEAQTTDEIKEAYLKGYDYGVKDWFKSKTQPCEDCVRREAVRKILVEAKEYGSWDDSSQINRQDVLDYVDMLPSVTPERPKEDGVEDFIKHKIDYLEELASIETNEGRWREEEKYLYAISVLEEVVEYMNTSGGKEDV